MSSLKKLVRNFPVIKQLVASRDKLYSELSAIRQELAALSASKENKLFFPPGHYYSPIPSLEYIKQHDSDIFVEPLNQIPGIDLRDKEQLKLLESFKPSYDDLPFTPQKTEKLRYYYENPSYSYSDAIFLYCMIRHARPKRIIEVGSGYSSCVALDTNELFFNNSIEMTFIEPAPDLLLSLIKETDKQHMRLIQSNLQEVNIARFADLEANDILFIDSTHVSKVYSDVNRIFFEILPTLVPGVFIHFHDIFYPFEYPRAWIYENRAWNELYLLRAFLQYNSSFRVILLNTFLEHFFRDYFDANMPLCMRNLGGSIWIQKI
jgi:predicted O-methyltransferase YrrM